MMSIKSLTRILCVGVVMGGASSAAFAASRTFNVEVGQGELERSEFRMTIQYYDMTPPAGWEVDTAKQDVSMPYVGQTLVIPGPPAVFLNKYSATVSGFLSGVKYKGFVERKNPTTNVWEQYRGIEEWTQP